jgi:hypothetical protein
MPVTSFEHVKRAINALPFESQDGMDARDINRDIIAGLDKAVLFDASKVALWLASMGMNGTDVSTMIAQLPTCIPPYALTFLEWNDDGVAASALVAYDSDDGQIMGHVFDVVHNSGCYIGDFGCRLFPDGRISTYFNLKADCALAQIELRPADYISRSFTMQQGGLWNDEMAPDKLYPLIVRGLGQAAMITLFTFSLLHCRNVITEDNDERTRLPRQAIRARERANKPFLVYKTLVVKPHGRHHTGNGKGTGIGTKKRMHLVRGHFAEYGPKYGTGLLFGRIEGRFFIPPHVRGDDTVGLVDKTYQPMPMEQR